MNIYEDDLWHYGTKGQEWGVQRYQNSDGTWTEEGKARRRAQYKASPKNEKTSSTKKKWSFSLKKKSKAVVKTTKESGNKQSENSEPEEKKEFSVSNYYDKKTNRTSAKSALKDLNSLTNSQIQEIGNRINAENTLYSYVAEENARNSNARKIKSIINKTISVVNTANNLYKATVKSPIGQDLIKAANPSSVLLSNNQNQNKNKQNNQNQNNNKQNNQNQNQNKQNK